MFGRPTIGEVYRRIEAVERSTQNSFKALDDRLTREMIGRPEYEAEHDAMDQRVKDLEDRDKEVSGYRKGLVIAVAAALVSCLGQWAVLAIHIS